MIMWGSILGSSLFFAGYAATNGLGLPQPEVNPPSIREGSTHGSKGVRTRYFIGGGLHRGK
jgi:hypothetical protein